MSVNAPNEELNWKAHNFKLLSVDDKYYTLNDLKGNFDGRKECLTVDALMLKFIFLELNRNALKIPNIFGGHFSRK